MSRSPRCSTAYVSGAKPMSGSGVRKWCVRVHLYNASRKPFAHDLARDIHGELLVISGNYFLSNSLGEADTPQVQIGLP